MDYNKTNLTKIGVWHKRIIISFWILCLIYLVGQFIFLVLLELYYPSESIRDYINRHIITPNILLALVMLFTELHNRFARKYREELTILSSILIAFSILITISPTIATRHIVLILPILVSIFYFDKKKLLIVSLTDLGLYVMLYSLSPYQRQNTTIFEFFVVVLMLAGVATAGNGIIRRGEELLRNIEELTKSEEKLFIEKTIIDKLSKTDALTNLYNHITFHEYLDGIIKQCYSNSNMPLHLALIDIDNFKKVNDTYGHRTGDTVLKKVSELMMAHITPNDFAARYGGEEFAIVFAEKTINEVFTIVEQIRKACEGASFFASGSEKVTISIGLHSYSGNEGKEALFNSTDALLYTAKRTGKNKTVCSGEIK